MFKWFEKLLIKLAKKILNKHAPKGEFLAYINKREEKLLKQYGGAGLEVKKTKIKSFIYLNKLLYVAMIDIKTINIIRITYEFL